MSAVELMSCEPQFFLGNARHREVLAVTAIRTVTREECIRFVESLRSLPLAGNDPGLLLALTDWTPELGRDVMYGCYTGGSLTGIILCTIERDLPALGRAYTLIGIVLVDPRCRGQGVGTRLIRFVQENASTGWVAASPGDERAERLFVRCGFRSVRGLTSEDEHLLVYCRRQLHGEWNCCLDQRKTLRNIAVPWD